MNDVSLGSVLAQASPQMPPPPYVRYAGLLVVNSLLISRSVRGTPRGDFRNMTSPILDRGVIVRKVTPCNEDFASC